MKKFNLPQLPYSADALAPYISEDTINLHYGVHTKGYFDNMNNLLSRQNLSYLTIDEIICNSDDILFNNAAQAWNHVFYFNSFSPKGGGEPHGKLAKAIKKKFGSFSDFKEAFTDAGTKIFGSGWVWLARDFEGELYIISKSNAGNPITEGLTPLLVFDVWEHAYYLDYKNKRANYLDALWHIVDWNVIEERY